MKNLSKKLEIVANAAIIVLAIVLTIVLAQKFFFDSSDKPETVKVGDEINIPELIFSKNEKTILVALQPHCPYCTESANFYRTIQNSISTKGSIRSVALFSPEIQTEKEYFRELNVEFDEIKKISFEPLKIRATPVILVLDKNGKIESVWNGKLPPQKENEFLS